MKTYRSNKDLPNNAVYLGSEHADGSMQEQLADAISDAIEPVCLIEDGSKHYFDLSN